MEDFVSLRDFAPEELLRLLERAWDIKAQPDVYSNALKGQSLAMIFEKPSTRTRMSFESGMHQLGGAAIYLFTRDSQLGRVSASRWASHTIASPASSPHISFDGRSPPQKAGRSGRPKMRQRISSSSCTQGTPAGLPSGMPGIGLPCGQVEGMPSISARRSSTTGDSACSSR